MEENNDKIKLKEFEKMIDDIINEVFKNFPEDEEETEKEDEEE